MWVLLRFLSQCGRETKARIQAGGIFERSSKFSPTQFGDTTKDPFNFFLLAIYTTPNQPTYFPALNSSN